MLLLLADAETSSGFDLSVDGLVPRRGILIEHRSTLSIRPLGSADAETVTFSFV